MGFVNRPHRFFIAGLTLILCISAVSEAPSVRVAADTLPSRLTDREFWSMIEEFSEPNGYFRSDNLLSNEVGIQSVIPDLLLRTKPGGVYMGVGPEQNFTYIASIKPRMAFIIDIRRGNMYIQLMYKALFELSENRAEFVALLFSRKRPGGLDSKSKVADIFHAYSNVQKSDEAAYKKNLKLILDLLVKKHGFSLSSDDLSGIENVYYNFYQFGPDINYTSSGQSFGRFGRFSRSFVTYATLMTGTDEAGVDRSYLANEENFKTVKDLEEKNLIVPLVGDFAGPKAIRAVGKYLKEHQVTVAAFYLSNVEQYLDIGWINFCASVASLPLDETSTFIRASHNGNSRFRRGLTTSLGAMQSETEDCQNK
jgi:hypothetical protein